MCEALRKLMQPEMDEARNEARNEVMTEAKLKEATQLLMYVQNVSKNSAISIEAACRLLEVPMDYYLNAQALLKNTNPN